MIQKIRYIQKFLFISLISIFFSCADLSVENENDPDTQKVLSNPGDVEALIGGSFQTWWHANQHPGIAAGLSTMADELTSQWGNWSIGTWAREPREAFINTPTSSQAEMLERAFGGLYGAISAVNDGLGAVIRSGIYNDSLRAIAFGRFMQGISHCGVALLFDQGYIIDENSDLLDEPVLYPYTDILEAGLGYLDECIELCENNTFSATPITWFNGNEIDNVRLGQLAHSYYARFLAAVARTETERAAVNWTLVAEHADAGITEPFEIDGDGNLWWDGLKYYSHNPGWFRVDYFTIGHADTSGAFETWANSEPADRHAFIIETADRRIAGADSNTAPGTDFRFAGPSYFSTYRDSYYEPYRYYDHYLSGAIAPMCIFQPAELRLLKAEALYRQNDLSGASDIINETRVERGQLPPVSAFDPNLWEILKYEKRIEIFMVAGGLMYFERRGWGELGTGAPLELPIPASELDILLMDYYTFGGEGGNMAAPKMAMGKNFSIRGCDRNWYKE